MKRSTRNAVKTKQEIIEKAALIFNINGYAGTKMQMIVEATGFQKGGIYRHFDSKMDLAKAAFRYNYACLKEVYFNQVLEQDSPKDQLLLFMKNYQAFIANPTINGGCPILNTATEMDDTNKTFRLLAKESVEDCTTILEGILLAGIKCGDFKASIDPKKEILFLFATVEGGIMMGQLNKDKSLVLDICDRLFAYMEDRIFV